jgi:hypothetical protein
MPQITKSFGGAAKYIYLKLKISGQKEKKCTDITPESITFIVIHTQSITVFLPGTQLIYTRGSSIGDQCGKRNFNKLSKTGC